MPPSDFCQYTMFPVSERYRQTTLLAIDPGLNNVGIAIFNLRLEPFKIEAIKAWTLKSEKLVDDSGLDDDDFIERLHKRKNIASALDKILQHYQPCIVVSESPFFDRRKPGSFEVLSEVMTTIMDTLIDHDPNIRFTTIPPLVVKQVLGVAGQKGKEVVKDAMGKEQTILSVLEGDFEKLDDHAIDAIGVGHAYLVKKSGLI